MDRTGFGVSGFTSPLKNDVMPPPPPLEKKASIKVPMNLSLPLGEEKGGGTDALSDNKVDALSDNDVRASGNSTMILFCSCCIWH